MQGFAFRGDRVYPLPEPVDHQNGSGINLSSLFVRCDVHFRRMKNRAERYRKVPG